MKHVNAQHLQNSAHIFVNSMDLLETGNHEVNADCDPDLGFDGVRAEAEKGFDAQVLFDPFEEQLDLPTTFVDSGDGLSRQVKAIGDKVESLGCLGVEVSDSTNALWIEVLGPTSVETDELVAEHGAVVGHFTGSRNVKVHILAGASDKECLGLMDAKETPKIDVSTIHDIGGPGFKDDMVEEVDIVDQCVCNAHKYWDGTSEIHLGMQLDRGLRLNVRRPGKQGQTQVDGRGVQGIDHLVESDYVRGLSVEAPRLSHENLGKVGVNVPGTMFVGVSQVGSGDTAADSHSMAMRTEAQACLDVAQAFAIGQLREAHGQELIARTQTATAPLHWVRTHTSIELRAMEKIENLREDQTPLVHCAQSQ